MPLRTSLVPALALLGALSSPALAESRSWSLGMAYSYLSTEEIGDPDAQFSALRLSATMPWNRDFGIEFDLGVPIDDQKDCTVDGLSEQCSADPFAGLYLRADADFAERIAV